MILSRLFKFEAKSDSINSYLVGFILSIFLTSISFCLVIYGRSLSSHVLLAALAILAFIQVIVHLVYFLHMNNTPEWKLNLITFIYALLTGLILIFGTMWVMHNAKMRMMS